MRSLQLSQNGVVPPPGFAPHTPNMSSIDAPSPAMGTLGLGQSPRVVTGGARAMARDQSKSGGGGAMLPPQSPATTIGRSNTPKPNPTKTPKHKDDTLVRLRIRIKKERFVADV